MIKVKCPKFSNVIIILIFIGGAYRFFQAVQLGEISLFTKILYGFVGLSLAGSVLLFIGTLFEKPILCPICGKSDWVEVPTWYPHHYCPNCERAEYTARGTHEEQVESIITYEKPKDYSVYYE